MERCGKVFITKKNLHRKMENIIENNDNKRKCYKTKYGKERRF